MELLKAKTLFESCFGSKSNDKSQNEFFHVKWVILTKFSSWDFGPKMDWYQLSKVKKTVKTLFEPRLGWKSNVEFQNLKFEFFYGKWVITMIHVRQNFHCDILAQKWIDINYLLIENSIKRTRGDAFLSLSVWEIHFKKHNSMCVTL